MVETFIEEDSVKLFYRHWSNEDKQALLLIHGNTLDSSIFIEFIENNQSLNSVYDIYALDLPGFGNSERLESYTIEGFAKSITNFIEALGLKKVNLLGFSLGGHLCLQSLIYSEKIERITVLSALPIQKPINFEKIFALHPVNAFLFNENWESSEINQFSLALDLSFDSIENMYQNCDPKTRVHLAMEIASGNFQDEWNILQNSKAKITLLIGENDGLLNLNYFDEIPIDTKQSIKNCGHNLLQSDLSNFLG